MRNKFSGTTFLLIVILLGALVGIGTLVNPKPPGPGEQPKSEHDHETEAAETQGDKHDANKPAPGKQPTGSQAEAMRKQMMEFYKGKEKVDRLRKAQEAQIQKMTGRKVIDPSQIEVSSDHFREYDMGAAGNKEMDKDVEIAKSVRQKNPIPMFKPKMAVDDGGAGKASPATNKAQDTHDHPGEPH